MQKVKVYKCPQCGAKYKSLQTWGNHVSNIHPELIPKDWSYARYFYYVLTGKSHGSCIVCKKDTKWNEGSQKYERFCDDPECKNKYREMFKKRMIKKYGKVSLLDDPEQQRKMLKGRKISGMYTFENGKQIPYVGTYEKNFLYMLDRFLGFDPDDIMMPSPHTYQYDYKNPDDPLNEGKHFYIPDAYIPSLNLEIEIKQNTNMHPKLLKIDKVKEIQKDELMNSIPDINYIKIVEKDYSLFFDKIEELSKTIETSNGEKVALEVAFTPYEDDYLPNGRKKLKDFKIGKLDLATINSYKGKEAPDLRYVRYNRNTSGEIVIDKNKVVGFYQTEKKDDVIWLIAFEILPAYRGYGLGSQLLNRAIRFKKITNLTVGIQNDVAIKLYLNNGFIEYGRDNYLIYMRLPDR